MKRVALALITAGFATAAASGVLHMPAVGALPPGSGLQGPMLPGLKQEIYGIWESNEVGTDVCFPSRWYVRQLSICGRF